MCRDAKNLVVDVDEKTTGHVSLGAGFSTVDSLVGIAEYNESNFNLSHPFEPPWFRGGGQKFRLRVDLGTVRQDYEMTFHRALVPGSQTAVERRFVLSRPCFPEPQQSL